MRARRFLCNVRDSGAFNSRTRLGSERGPFPACPGMKPLSINLVPSPGLAILVIALHSGAAAVGALLPIDWVLKVVLIVSVVWNLCRNLQTVALLRASEAITNLRVSSEGHLFAQTRGGAWLDCELLPSSYVSSLLTILNLRGRQDRELRHVVLCCRNANSADVRRFRTWLRWGPGKP